MGQLYRYIVVCLMYTFLQSATLLARLCVQNYQAAEYCKYYLHINMCFYVFIYHFSVSIVCKCVCTWVSECGWRNDAPLCNTLRQVTVATGNIAVVCRSTTIAAWKLEMSLSLSVFGVYEWKIIYNVYKYALTYANDEASTFWGF